MQAEQGKGAIVPSERILRSPCVMLSPHSDDLAFSLGAALIDGRFALARAVVVFPISACTADDSDSDVERVTEMRKAEDAAFFGSVAGFRWTYLDRYDAPLRLGIAEEAVCAYSDEWRYDAESEPVASSLEACVAHDSLVLAPLGLGGHIDHKIVRAAVVSLMADRMAVAFYEDLPYAGAIPLAEIAKHVVALSAQCGCSLTPCILQSRLRTSEKLRVIGAYKSQIDASILARIEEHGERIGDGRIAERIWCNSAAVSLVCGSGAG